MKIGKKRVVDLSHTHGEGIVCEPYISKYQVDWLEKAGIVLIQERIWTPLFM